METQQKQPGKTPGSPYRDVSNAVAGSSSQLRNVAAAKKEMEK